MPNRGGVRSRDEAARRAKAARTVLPESRAGGSGSKRVTLAGYGPDVGQAVQGPRPGSGPAAEPRAKLSCRGLRWALEGVVVQHLTVARVADGLDVAENEAGVGSAVAHPLADRREDLVLDPWLFLEHRRERVLAHDEQLGGFLDGCRGSSATPEDECDLTEIVARA
jgi:hypothetical protein